MLQSVQGLLAIGHGMCIGGLLLSCAVFTRNGGDEKHDDSRTVCGQKLPPLELQICLCWLRHFQGKPVALCILQFGEAFMQQWLDGEEPSGQHFCAPGADGRNGTMISCLER